MQLAIALAAAKPGGKAKDSGTGLVRSMTDQSGFVALLSNPWIGIKKGDPDRPVRLAPLGRLRSRRRRGLIGGLDVIGGQRAVEEEAQA